MTRFRDRPTGDILVMLIAGTVCFSVLASGCSVVVLAFFRPETDVTLWVSRITGIVNTMIGLLAGFLAGRTHVYQSPVDPAAAPTATPKPQPGDPVE